MKYLFNFLFLTVMLYACTSKDDEPIRFRHPFQVKFNAVIRQGDKDVSKSYRHIYGVGQPDSLIKLIEHPFLKQHYDTFYWDSFYYPLPLNSNADTVVFCLVRNNNAVDSVGITYQRVFSAGTWEGYRYKPESARIFYLSPAFLKDSCKLEEKRDYLYYYNGPGISTNLKLVLKP